MVKDVIELKILDEELILDYTIDPKCNHAYPYRREVERGLRHTHKGERRQSEHRGRVWSDASTN